MSINKQPYKITIPQKKKVGILLSIPHCGFQFPEEIEADYNPKMKAQPDDTDWDLNLLYDFASDLGITTIEAVYSRWVIDLNRTPQNKSQKKKCVRPQTDTIRLVSSKLMLRGGVPVVWDSRFDRFFEKSSFLFFELTNTIVVGKT